MCYKQCYHNPCACLWISFRSYGIYTQAWDCWVTGYVCFLLYEILPILFPMYSIVPTITYWHYTRIPVAPYSPNICSDFIISSNVLDVWCYLTVVLISICLIPNKIEHMFIFIRHLGFFFVVVKSRFILFINISIYLLLFTGEYFLYILDTKYLPGMFILKSFPTLWLVFILCVVSGGKETRSCITNKSLLWSNDYFF